MTFYGRLFLLISRVGFGPSNALGHTQVSTTTNIYDHTFAKVQADVSDAIAAELALKSYI